jgi:hypothetical protein
MLLLAVHAATPPSIPDLQDAGEDLITPMGVPLRANLLDNAILPPGTNATIKSFTVGNSPTTHTPGSGPVTLVSPTTGATVGSLQVQPNGDFTFTPAPGYVGPTPTVTYVVASTDGQKDTSALNINVVPGEARACASGVQQHDGMYAALCCACTVGCVK